MAILGYIPLRNQGVLDVETAGLYINYQQGQSEILILISSDPDQEDCNNRELFQALHESPHWTTQHSLDDELEISINAQFVGLEITGAAKTVHRVTYEVTRPDGMTFTVYTAPFDISDDGSEYLVFHFPPEMFS